MLEVNRVNSKQAVFFHNVEKTKSKEDENLQRENVDSMDISKEGMERCQSAGKQMGYQENVYDINEMGKDAWEKATGIKVWGYLESTSVDGSETNVFQKCQKNQYTVFQDFLEKNKAFDIKIE